MPIRCGRGVTLDGLSRDMAALPQYDMSIGETRSYERYESPGGGHSGASGSNGTAGTNGGGIGNEGTGGNADRMLVTKGSQAVKRVAKRVRN